MRTRAISSFFFLVSAIICSGCATVTNGTSQSIAVNSSPPGAAVIIDGIEESSTPCSVMLKRKSDHTIAIEMPGHHREEFAVTRQPTGKIHGNFWLGGLIGYAVDAATGADNELVPGDFNVTLRPVRAEAFGAAVTSANRSITVQD